MHSDDQRFGRHATLAYLHGHMGTRAYIVHHRQETKQVWELIITSTVSLHHHSLWVKGAPSCELRSADMVPESATVMPKASPCLETQ